MGKLSVSMGKPFMAMLALALVSAFAVGMAFVGCKTEVEDDPLNGTYVGGNATLVLNNGNWTAKENGIDASRGTYTASDGTITLTLTDQYFDSEGASQYNTTAGWKNRSEMTAILRGLGWTEAEINEGLAPMIGTYSGNTITMGSNTLTRQ